MKSRIAADHYAGGSRPLTWSSSDYTAQFLVRGMLDWLSQLTIAVLLRDGLPFSGGTYLCQRRASSLEDSPKTPLRLLR
jgi:hypothetical protein